jgi:SAM-dependent methyltransferase
MMDRQPEGETGAAVAEVESMIERSMLVRMLLGFGCLAVLALGARPAGAPEDPVPARAPGLLFDPADAWLLEEPARDRWQKPVALVAALGLRPGQAVADVGAGSGYMMPHLARVVGPAGRVYAEDVQAGMVRLLRARARRHPNVVVVRGQTADPCLPARSIDAALLLTSYHELRAPVALLARLRRSMRPGGRLAIVDFNDFETDGAAPRVPYADRVPEQTVVREAARAGWRLVRRDNFLSYEYCLIFRPLDGRVSD